MIAKEVAAKHKTSIIIVTHNNLEYNRLCLESIKKYTKGIDHEIIFVDNNSTDGTSEWLSGLEGVKVIFNKKKMKVSPEPATKG